MNYGTSLPQGFLIPKSAFWLKKDLTPEGNPFKHLRLQPGDRVMDCGLYIGTFTAACLEQGAGAIRAYEAAPENAVFAKANLERYGDRVQIVEAAITATDASEVELTMSGFDGANSILPSANRKQSATVPAINFRRELLDFRPQVVKLDVEGAEYDLMDSLQPGDLAALRCIFIEFHPIENQATRVVKVIDYVQTEGLIVESSRRRTFTASRDAESLFT